MRKLKVSNVPVRGTTMYVGNEETSKLVNTDDNMKNECIVKRGSMCTMHGCVGEKFTVSKKVWERNKSGVEMIAKQKNNI